MSPMVRTTQQLPEGGEWGWTEGARRKLRKCVSLVTESTNIVLQAVGMSQESDTATQGDNRPVARLFLDSTTRCSWQLDQIECAQVRMMATIVRPCAANVVRTTQQLPKACPYERTGWWRGRGRPKCLHIVIQRDTEDVLLLLCKTSMDMHCFYS